MVPAISLPSHHSLLIQLLGGAFLSLPCRNADRPDFQRLCGWSTAALIQDGDVQFEPQRTLSLSLFSEAGFLCVDQAVLELRDPPTSASWVLD